MAATRKKTKSVQDKKHTIKLEDRPLNLKQKLFAKYYIFGSWKCKTHEEEFILWNATQSYGKAYSKNMSTDAQKVLCWSEWYSNINKPHIKKYMWILLKWEGFNHNIIDSRLLWIIKNGEDKDAISAIKEYNKLLDRITERFQWSVSVNIAEELKNLTRKPQRPEE